MILNIKLNLSDNLEDILRNLNPKWNEPQKQPINGGIFNSKGEFVLDWDYKNSSRFKSRSHKLRGILEKNVGNKFDEVYSKLCKSGFADKPLWYGSTVREKFLSYFKNGRYSKNEYYVDDEGYIRKTESKKRKRRSKDIVIYGKPSFTYSINHSNLESISKGFIENFGENLYLYLQSLDEISEDIYLKFVSTWKDEDCIKAMSSRRAKEFKPSYIYLGESNINLFRFIFDKRYIQYKEIIPYKSKKYYEYIRTTKRKNKYSWRKLSPEDVKIYDNDLKQRKHE